MFIDRYLENSITVSRIECLVSRKNFETFFLLSLLLYLIYGVQQ